MYILEILPNIPLQIRRGYSGEEVGASVAGEQKGQEGGCWRWKEINKAGVVPDLCVVCAGQGSAGVPDSSRSDGEIMRTNLQAVGKPLYRK